MASLFTKEMRLDFPDMDITYLPNFLSPEASTHYFEVLKERVPWRQDSIRVYGKAHLQPRLTAFFASNQKSYSYSNITMPPLPFSKELLEIKLQLEAIAQVGFTSCLLNLYRNGKDSNGWHADDEKELGHNPVIASISLGQERFFHLKHKKDAGLKHKILLEHGSLLLMQGPTQQHWLHQIPKSTRSVKERINLTFRIIQ